MGEVYRGSDTTLKRTVAIKVLPESLASDADRLARFQREAEVLASLNHPNIAVVYGLERTLANAALVMEFVEGPTLAERLADTNSELPLDDVLAIARQITDYRTKDPRPRTNVSCPRSGRARTHRSPGGR